MTCQKAIAWVGLSVDAMDDQLVVLSVDMMDDMSAGKKAGT
jgi:hypothetical protein